jgi:predicted RNase H-like HicB family nuclease
MACAAGGALQPAADGAAARRATDNRQAPGRKEKGQTMKISVRIVKSERGDYVATCPSLPGCTTRGQTPDQARQCMGDAVRGYLASVCDFVFESTAEELIIEA